MLLYTQGPLRVLGVRVVRTLACVCLSFDSQGAAKKVIGIEKKGG